MTDAGVLRRVTRARSPLAQAAPLVLGVPTAVGWLVLAMTGNLSTVPSHLAGGTRALLRTLPWLGIVAVVAFALERRRPARRDSHRKSAATQDTWWFLLSPVLNTAFTLSAFFATNLLFDRFVPIVAFSSLAEQPRIARIVGAFLLADLAYYACHVARHRIPLLWRFHSIHHSQSTLNVFTNWRLHPLDELSTTVPIVILFRLLGLPLDVGATIPVLTLCLSVFVHSNVRTSFGRLGSVVVSPQFHRVHHSSDHHHQNANFGGSLVIWDRLFRTTLPAAAGYPATGWQASAGGWHAGWSSLVADLVSPLRAARQTPVDGLRIVPVGPADQHWLETAALDVDQVLPSQSL